MYPLGHIVSEISSTVILGSALLLLAAPRARAQPTPVAAARSLTCSATLSLAASINDGVLGAPPAEALSRTRDKRAKVVRREKKSF